MSSNTNFKYHWFASGDIAASATIVFDNLAVLTFMALILQFGYHFPLEVIMSHIIPGTVVGVMVGNLLCLWLGFRLAKKAGRNVTAMPFGLDAPSAIGFVVCIIGPAFSYLYTQGLDSHAAGIKAWQIGVGCLFTAGIIKLIFSFFANRLKAIIPQPALLGAIGGVAIALIGFFPLNSIFKVPSVGFLSLTIVMLTMFAKVKLPFRLSGIPVAIVLGTVVYYLLSPLGLSGAIPNLTANITFLLPTPTFAFMHEATSIINYLPVIFPFALLVIFGTMSVVESADCMGDEYVVRDLMLIDGVATIVSSFFGGVLQTTPYAGFPAYKKMDARAGFLLINIVVVGMGGIVGLVGFIVNLVPEVTVAPVLFYVAFEIAMQGFMHSDKKHYPVILFAIFPSIARLVEIKITDGSLIPVDKLQEQMFANVLPTISDHLAIVVLGNGFIVTGMLWATMLYFAMERKWMKSFVSSCVLAVLAFFGIIHSLYISGQLYLPWSLPESVRNIPYELALGYLFFGVITLLLSKTSANR
jgi:AGZA family xanthine/uracil permease-like MFS transporter